MPLRPSTLIRSGAVPAFVLTTLALAAGQALAQASPAAGTESAEGAGMQSITVTARRVDERIIDVPLSIRALSGRDLADRGITGLTDLASFVPGIAYSPDLGRVAERPVVRGISALRPEAPQPVSVFIDGIFLREGALSLLLDDAQRVEVIKGPQSALYGRATYAGAINYVTTKPGNEMKGMATVTLAQANEMSAFAAVTVPLKKDVASMRIKARTHEYGGQYTNTQTGNKIGHESNDALGLVMSLTPSKSLDMLLSLDRSMVRDGLFNATARTVPTQQPAGTVVSQNNSTNVPNGATCNGRTINIVGNNAQGIPDASVAPTAAARANGWPCGPANFTGTNVTRNENDLANYTDPSTGINYGNIAGLDRTINRLGFTLNYDFGGYTLTAQTGWTKQFTALGADQSYNGTRFSIAGASWLSYNRDALRYWSQEVRLSSPEDRPLTWLIGAFVYDEEGSGQSAGGVIARSGPNIVATSMRAVPGSVTTNSAPFARMQYEISKALRVSLEGRYNKETVEVVGTPLGVATVSAGTCVAGQQCIVSGKRTFTDFSPRVTVDFKPGKESLIYGQVAKGSKSGGFNTAAGIPTAQFAYDGEDIRSVELGYKAALGGSLGFSAAAFRNDIDGLQLSNIITITNPFPNPPGAVQSSTVTIVNNVGKARTQGLEFDLSWRAADWLTLTANYAFTDAKALQGTEITNGTVFGGNMSVAGFTLPRTPKHSGALSLAVDTPVAGGSLRFIGRADLTYQSRRYAEIQNTIWADPYTRLNLSAGLRGKGWTARLWVKNATNDDTSLNGFRYLDPVTFRRSAVDFLPRLRQFGVTASYDF
ncbi:MAG: TonB-dependent receptor [Rubrivivax sp.]|jgi:outer membrane receptor protein involved in Fe transport|nr:TonB-dependent receptor [Rubrivivax sp.]